MRKRLWLNGIVSHVEVMGLGPNAPFEMTMGQLEVTIPALQYKNLPFRAIETTLGRTSNKFAPTLTNCFSTSLSNPGLTAIQFSNSTANAEA